jgi:phosphate transport system permease protein
LSAIFISEYSSTRYKILFSSFIDILSGIPSVVFGLCALLYLVPFVSFVMDHFFGIETTGMSVFTAGITLAVMSLPIIISLTVESLQSVPKELREVSLSLGATKWQTIKKILFRAAGPGIISAILLGFGRAFGETMAVAMIIGSKNKIPDSVFSAGQTLPSLIINSFGEMMSVPLQQSALIFVALTLFVIVTITNSIAKVINNYLAQKWRY